jgi:hypothetical protein
VFHQPPTHAGRGPHPYGKAARGRSPGRLHKFSRAPLGAAPSLPQRKRPPEGHEAARRGTNWPGNTLRLPRVKSDISKLFCPRLGRPRAGAGFYFEDLLGSTITAPGTDIRQQRVVLGIRGVTTPRHPHPFMRLLAHWPRSHPTGASFCPTRSPTPERTHHPPRCRHGCGRPLQQPASMRLASSSAPGSHTGAIS